jgi:histidyl-tRNA synthetase
MLYGFLADLGLEGLQVSVNSLGNQDTRSRYRDTLISYLEPLAASLSPHAGERFRQNPLRVLDSKDPRDQSIAEGAPSILDALSTEDRAHWDGVLGCLDALDTPYRVNPRLVRGLDYYTRTTFEISAVTGELGAQNALLGGGRYDDMIQGLGGPATPAIGFAMGLERILLALGDIRTEQVPWVALAPMGEAALRQALVLAKRIRRAGLVAEVDGRGTSLKSMLRRANGGGARFCVVVGESEVTRKVVQLKDLELHQQEEVQEDSLIASLKGALLATPSAPESEARG